MEQETLAQDAAQSAPSVDPEAVTEPALTASQQLLTQITDFMQVGGPVVWILTALSVIALAITLVKLVQFAAQQPEKASHLPKVL